MELDGMDIDFNLELSPPKLRGLSHREWGDGTETPPILIETGNPSQGRLRSRTDEALVLTGKDKAYCQGARSGAALYTIYRRRPAHRFTRREARHGHPRIHGNSRVILRQSLLHRRHPDLRGDTGKRGWGILKTGCRDGELKLQRAG